MVDFKNCFAERTALVWCDLSVVSVDFAAGMPDAGVFPFEPDAGATISLGSASVALEEEGAGMPDAGAAISERVLGGE